MKELEKETSKQKILATITKSYTGPYHHKTNSVSVSTSAT